jgi:hypothetical protein
VSEFTYENVFLGFPLTAPRRVYDRKQEGSGGMGRMV